MLKIIYGTRGMGKTKRMCSSANERANASRGTVVFIDKDNDHMYELNRDVRFINALEYGVRNKDTLKGFIAGIAARDFDLDALYINSFAKLLNSPVDEAEDIIAFLAGSKSLYIFTVFSNSFAAFS